MANNYPPESRILGYLARAESRLSTMHRVAGVFVGGAGLLTLIPFLVKDVFKDIARLIDFNGIDFVNNTISALIMILLSTTLFVCLAALLYLFKDLVLFYFSPHEESGKVFLPRFGLSALSLPIAVDGEDENNKKDKIDNLIRNTIEVQYEKKLFDFIIPNDKTSTLYLNYNSNFNVTPTVISDRRKDACDFLVNDYKKREKKFDVDYVLTCLEAMGTAGLQDRNLLEEAARIEISLSRHANNLRKLVLRYFKSILLIGSRIIFLFMIGFFLHGLIPEKAKNSLAVGYQQYPLAYIILFSTFLIASSLTPFIIRRPINWIHELSAINKRPMTSQVDQDISFFEKFTFYVVLGEIISSLVGIMIVWGPPGNIGLLVSIVIVIVFVSVYVVTLRQMHFGNLLTPPNHLKKNDSVK